MTELAVRREVSGSQVLALPEPRTAISTRPAVQDDLAFIDGLQKKHTKMVGWFPTKQIETNIEQGHVLIAEAPGGSPVAYCIARDRYFKREDVGIIYQLNVMPIRQRGLIGASLIKAVFERSAYGCKLFCCWCAQDLEANHFWESIGFVPLAFRTGSRGPKKGEPRIHIFWQKRIREGDRDTPYWYPSQTTGGAVRENWLVLPIPPGTHWSDAKPAVLPGMEEMRQEQLALEAAEQASKPKRKRRPRKKKEVVRPNAITSGGLRFGPPPADDVAKDATPKREKRKPQKNDPKYVAAARELRDKYLEAVNDPSGEGAYLLSEAQGKYDVSRQLESAPSAMPKRDALVTESATPLLDAA